MTRLDPNPHSPYADAAPDVRHIFPSPIFFPQPAPGVLALTACEGMAVVPEELTETRPGAELPEGLCPACVTVMQGGAPLVKSSSQCGECGTATWHGRMCALCRQEAHEKWVADPRQAAGRVREVQDALRPHRHALRRPRPAPHHPVLPPLCRRVPRQRDRGSPVRDLRVSSRPAARVGAAGGRCPQPHHTDLEITMTDPIAPAPPTDEPRRPAYDAVFAFIRGLGEEMPPTTVHRNAVIWRAVHTALDGMGVPSADRSALRDRIAEALALRDHGPASDGRGWFRDEEERQARLADAAAVLRVLPEPADRAAVEAERDSLGREADRLRKDWLAMRARAERAEAEVQRLVVSRVAEGERPLSPYFEHPECGFRWHGRDGMDVPMRDGQPVCPRCELRRLEKLLDHRERRNDELRAECKRRGRNVLEHSEKNRALEREIDGVRRHLGAEILRADAAEAELRRLAVEAQQPAFQDRGDAARRAAGIDGTAGDAQDIPHDFVLDEPTGACLLCGLAPSYRKHDARKHDARKHDARKHDARGEADRG